MVDVAPERWVEYAVEANLKHGLPVSTADRTEQVKLFLALPGRSYTDIRLAEIVGLGKSTVHRIRTEMGGETSENLKRRRVAAYLEAHPNTSNSQAAKSLGVSRPLVIEVGKELAQTGSVADVDRSHDTDSEPLDGDVAMPVAKRIRRPATAGQQVIQESNRHLAEITNPALFEHLVAHADPDDEVELAATWRAIGEAAFRIAEKFEASFQPAEEG